MLSTLRDTTEDQLDGNELAQAEQDLSGIRDNISELGELSPDVTALQYQRLWQSGGDLLDIWLAFYRNYNDPEFDPDVEDPLPYLEAIQRL